MYRSCQTGTLGISHAFDPQVLLPSENASIGQLLDRVVWQTTLTLPATNNKPARLVLREFERYYTDRTIPDKYGAQTYHKRVVEERLFYSEFFPPEKTENEKIKVYRF